jgi:hypothetical protein
VDEENFRNSRLSCFNDNDDDCNYVCVCVCECVCGGREAANSRKFGLPTVKSLVEPDFDPARQACARLNTLIQHFECFKNNRKEHMRPGQGKRTDERASFVTETLLE